MRVSDEIRERVLGLCREGQRLDAISELKFATGWDHARAKAWLDEQFPPPPPPTVFAGVYAIGAFHSSLADCWEYGLSPPHDGMRISFYLAEASGEEDVVKLANAFGVDAFDLDAHALSPTRADFERYAATKFCDLEVEQMERLRERGFRFFLHVEKARDAMP